MAKIGRNTPCPCGSGKKYKHCCERKEKEIEQRKLPVGRFSYKYGSYGATILTEEDDAGTIAKKHLDAAYAFITEGGSPQAFALSLRHEGYKNITDFHVVSIDDGYKFRTI